MTLAGGSLIFLAFVVFYTAVGRGAVARRGLRFHRGPRHVRLRLPRAARPGTRIALRASAWTQAGWRATRVRTVRVRRP